MILDLYLSYPSCLKFVVQNQLLRHLSTYNLLSSCQSGFRPQHSTQDVLLHVTDSWRRANDHKQFVGTVFLDITKAFDCIDHSILLSKLSYYGKTGSSLNWFMSYLSNRHQKIRFNTQFSDWGLITRGVPQGSILGPTLFRSILMICLYQLSTASYTCMPMILSFIIVMSHLKLFNLVSKRTWRPWDYG